MKNQILARIKVISTFLNIYEAPSSLMTRCQNSSRLSDSGIGLAMIASTIHSMLVVKMTLQTLIDRTAMGNEIAMNGLLEKLHRTPETLRKA